MQTNNAELLYKQAERASSMLKNKQSTTPNTGLLSPMRSRNQNNDSVKDNPAYRAIEIFNTLNAKRMEIKNG
jgi:hypothetical protein